MAATLLLLAISIAIDDPRWRQLRVDALLGIDPIRHRRQPKDGLKDTPYPGWRRWQNARFCRFGAICPGGSSLKRVSSALRSWPPRRLQLS